MFGAKKQEPVTYTVTVAWYSTNTTGLQTADMAVDFEDAIRRIVREEMAELVPVDVPDAPPEDLR